MVWSRSGEGSRRFGWFGSWRRGATSVGLAGLLAGLGALIAACGDEEAAELEIVGNYSDEFGSVHTVSKSEWRMDSSGAISRFAVLEFDNSLNYMIAQNDAANAFSANLFSRFDWTERDEQLFYCQTAYEADTAEAARNTIAANSADPASTGCAGFAWTRLTPAE